MPGPLVVPLAIGAATAIGNLFGNAAAASQREEALARYRKKLIDAKYDPVEKAKEIDRVGDAFNTEIADAQNSSAFGLGRYLNSNTAKAVGLSKMLGQRSGAMVEKSSALDAYNKGIDLQLAESELSEPIRDPLGDLIEGGAAGMQLGMSIGNYTSELDWNQGIMDFLGNKGTGGNRPSPAKGVKRYGPGGRFKKTQGIDY